MPIACSFTDILFLLIHAACTTMSVLLISGWGFTTFRLSWTVFIIGHQQLVLVLIVALHVYMISFSHLQEQNRNVTLNCPSRRAFLICILWHILCLRNIFLSYTVFVVLLCCCLIKTKLWNIIFKGVNIWSVSYRNEAVAIEDITGKRKHHSRDYQNSEMQIYLLIGINLSSFSSLSWACSFLWSVVLVVR